MFWDSGIKYFGIGGAVTNPENIGLREAVSKMPMESVILETDSAFRRPQRLSERLNSL